MRSPTTRGIWFSLAGVVIVYASMGAIAVGVLRSMARRWRESDSVDLPTPYGPPARSKEPVA